MVNRITPFVLTLVVLVSFTSADIKELKLTSDPRLMILIDNFGFTQTGHATITVSNVSVSSQVSPHIPSSLGFFLVADEYLTNVLHQLHRKPSMCPLDSHFVTSLFTFRSLSLPPPYYFNHSYPITSSPGQYSLIFSNCHPQTSISMSVRTELYNLDPVSTKVYLSAGLTQLPTIFLLFALCYFCFLALWTGLCLNNVNNHIHFLMAGLLLVKALSLICAAKEMHNVKVTGTAHGWNVLCYFFESITVVLLCIVIVLIGTGMKPFLQGREKKALMILIPLQVIAYLASPVIGETELFVENWVTWNRAFLLVDIVCCCAIIFPITWSIRSLLKTKRNLAKLFLIRQFYIVVIGYLYFTRIVGFGLSTVTAYKYQWVSKGAEEAVSLAFYILISYMFRLVEKNKYFVPDERGIDSILVV